MKCPTCGANASGKFCSSCGAQLSAAACAACGAALSAGAKFCHGCGAPTGRAAGPAVRGVPGAGRRNNVPWLVGAALVVVALVVLAITQLNPGGPATTGPAAAPNAPGPVDLSQLSPREAADRLFNRVMSADEGGARDTARFFAPMAIQAYAMVGDLDPDARYHLGLLHIIAENSDGALAQADTITQGVPGHLYAAVLRVQAAQLRGDDAARRRAEQAFLTNYDAEVAADRPEYRDHPGLLERYRAEILARQGTPGR